MVLSNLGRREQALGATEEAVEIYRGLAAANPAAFETDLAKALNNLGMGLSNLGRREPALQATEEAVEIYGRLAAANPAAFEPDLAKSLWAYAWVRAASEYGLAEAFTAVQEAAEIYGRLARSHPEVFTDDLRGTLRTLADVLDGLDRHDEAGELRRSLDADE
jgi:tetratricopeptide (TPR) repeat protein